MTLYTRKQLKAKGQSLSKSLNASSSKILMSESTKFAITKTFDIFLSHSYLDADEVLALKADIEEMRFSVYVDWLEDKQLSRENVTKHTANTLRTRMQNCSCLFFAATDNSTRSKWMPWELGYFDGTKNGKVAVLPVTDKLKSHYQGQEYLGLYYYVDKQKDRDGDVKLWINESLDTYVSLEQWLNGEDPYKRE